MNVVFTCPYCQAGVRHEFSHSTALLTCDHCGNAVSVGKDAIADDRIDRCLVCPSRDLYVRKDMPQRLGLTIVVVGIVTSSIAWAYHQIFWTFALLFSTALIDFLLFFVIGSALMCYRCHAQYRGVQNLDAFGGFDLEIHERYRQMGARMDPRRPTQPAATAESNLAHDSQS